MKLKLRQNGFTLIEMLIAVTMITLVFGMVYGTSSAISKSIRSYNAKRELTLPAKTAFVQMTRQLRCAFAPLQNNINETEKPVNYFSCTGKPESYLNLITSGGNSAGLYEVAYKFDEAEGTLLYKQRQFAAAAANNELNDNWRPVASGIEKIVFKFFDGKTWQQSWNWKEKQNLPQAVSIELTLKDKRNVQFKYETTALVSLAQNQRNQIESKQLASTRKQ
jgi:type II secretion system protein J